VRQRCVVGEQLIHAEKCGHARRAFRCSDDHVFEMSRKRISVSEVRTCPSTRGPGTCTGIPGRAAAQSMRAPTECGLRRTFVCQRGTRHLSSAKRWKLFRFALRARCGGLLASDRAPPHATLLVASRSPTVARGFPVVALPPSRRHCPHPTGQWGPNGEATLLAGRGETGRSRLLVRLQRFESKLDLRDFFLGQLQLRVDGRRGNASARPVVA